MTRCFASIVASVMLLGALTVVAQTTPTVWTRNIVPLQQTSAPVVSASVPRYVVVAQDIGTIVAMDTKNGNILWTYTVLNETQQAIYQISTDLTAAVVVWAASGIVALDPASGEALWTNFTIVASSVLASDDAVLVRTYNSLIALSTTTGEQLYVRSQDTMPVSSPIRCGLVDACLLQFPVGGIGELVVFNLRTGNQSFDATTLRHANPQYVKRFDAVDATSVIVVYEEHVGFSRAGIAIVCVSLMNGDVSWSYSLPHLGQSIVSPPDTTGGVLAVMADLRWSDGPSSTPDLLVYQLHTGELLLNSTVNATAEGRFPSFIEMHTAHIWVGQRTPTSVTLTAFDMVTGLPVCGIMTPTTQTPALQRSIVYVPSGEGPRWVIPYSTGVTVWNALTGTFSSQTTNFAGIVNIQRTFGGKIIVSSYTAVVELQP